MTKVFVDSDGFVALTKEDDANHTKALRLLEQTFKENPMFLTSNYVFSEVVTVLSQRVSHQAALQFIQTVKSSSGYTIVWVDEDIEAEAINIFSSQLSKNTSFVDCTNMAIMKRENIDTIFSFDEVYKKNGFKLLW